jgi:hypothetical protein
VRPTRRPGLVVERVSDEVLVFDDTAQAAAALNPAATSVFDLCDGTRDIEEIIASAAEAGLSEDAVRLGLHELGEAGLVEDVPADGALSRRALLAEWGSTAAAAALALPVVEAFDRGPRATPGLHVSETEHGFSVSAPGRETPLLINSTGVLVLELANGLHSVTEIIDVVQRSFALDSPPQAEVLAFLDSASLCGLVASDTMRGQPRPTARPTPD